jgi:hypothetical protein
VPLRKSARYAIALVSKKTGMPESQIRMSAANMRGEGEMLFDLAQN